VASYLKNSIRCTGHVHHVANTVENSDFDCWYEFSN